MRDLVESRPITAITRPPMWSGSWDWRRWPPKIRKKLPVLDSASPIHQDSFDVTWHLGVQRNTEERQEFARQIGHS